MKRSKWIAERKKKLASVVKGGGAYHSHRESKRHIEHLSISPFFSNMITTCFPPEQADIALYYNTNANVLNIRQHNLLRRESMKVYTPCG